jgi:hypothetical protein
LTAERLSNLKYLLVLGLFAVLAVPGCGGKQSMEGAGEQEQAGSISTDVQPTTLAGEEEGVAQANFDEAEKARRMATLPKGSSASGPGKKSSVTVKEGETLWMIAERKDVYGSGWLYPLIYKANKDKLKDPKHPEAGLKLAVPRDVGAVEEEIAKEEAMTGQLLDGSPLPGSQPVKEVKVAKAPAPVKKRRSGKGWLWLLAAAVAGLGYYQWQRMKRHHPDEGATVPA